MGSVVQQITSIRLLALPALQWIGGRHRCLSDISKETRGLWYAGEMNTHEFEIDIAPSGDQGLYGLVVPVDRGYIQGYHPLQKRTPLWVGRFGNIWVGAETNLIAKS